LTPQDPRAAARMDQAMNINDWYLFPGVGNVILFQWIVRPKVLGLAPDEAAIAAAVPKAVQVFDALAKTLGHQTHFAGDAFTLADALIAPHLDFFAATPEWTALTESNPNLVSWLDRMNDRRSLRATTWERVAAMGRSS
jgi:glutathione S-transferase